MPEPLSAIVQVVRIL